MGLPEVNIVFRSLAISAIERSERGIVALIVNDDLATEKSYVGNLVNLAGGDNVLEDASISFAQVNKEELLNLNPDKIVVMAHANPEITNAEVKEALETDAAWKNLDAVKNKEVHYLDSEYFGMSANLKVIEALDKMHDILY